VETSVKKNTQTPRKSEHVKIERESKIGYFHKSDGSSKNQLRSKLRLVRVGSKFSHSVPLAPSSFARSTVKSDNTQRIPAEHESIEVQGRGCKRRFFGNLIVVLV